MNAFVQKIKDFVDRVKALFSRAKETEARVVASVSQKPTAAPSSPYPGGFIMMDPAPKSNYDGSERAAAIAEQVKNPNSDRQAQKDERKAARKAFEAQDNSKLVAAWEKLSEGQKACYRASSAGSPEEVRFLTNYHNQQLIAAGKNPNEWINTTYQNEPDANKNWVDVKPSDWPGSK